MVVDPAKIFGTYAGGSAGSFSADLLNKDGKQEEELSPFDHESREKSRTCPYFHDSDISNHLKALNQGPIGKFLTRFRDKEKIRLVRNRNMEENRDGTYKAVRGSRYKGEIEYGDHMNALLLGHELRHGWQHLKLSPFVSNPQSAEEQILYERFIEADGRAVEFGVTLQIIHAMHLDNEYAENLLSCLDPYEKEILEYSFEKLEEIAASPDKTKQAMRQAFDWWIAHSPTAPDVYDDQTEKSIGMASNSRLYKFIFNITNKGDTPRPCFTHTGIRPEYVQKLVSELGHIGYEMGESYLTCTEGPDFMSAFYTRPCNHALEKGAELQRKILTKEI